MPDNRAILLLGSNIDPAANIKKALELINSSLLIVKISRIWITEAVGSNGPDFLNVAVEVKTGLTSEILKKKIIIPLETELKRVRTTDKFAPRTIDIDIIIFNGKVLDENLWKKLFIALPVSEIFPDLYNGSTGETLLECAENLKSSAKAEPYKQI
jgi:2-amino-4-hydroxy-6-hydroxymethyldihydropteridine diphosphokinase